MTTNTLNSNQISTHGQNSQSHSGENPEDEELLQNVLQDIANQTKKDKNLFNQTLMNSSSEADYDTSMNLNVSPGHPNSNSYTGSDEGRGFRSEIQGSRANSGLHRNTERNPHNSVSFNSKLIGDDHDLQADPDVVYTTYQPTPMEVLKESVKWSAIVSLLVFIFSQPRVLQKISQYLPTKFLNVDMSLNVWGTALLSLIAGAIYFVLFHWVL